MAIRKHWSVEEESHSARQQWGARDNGRDGKLLAIRRDTPSLFPISSTRDVSRWISINRRGRTIKRVRVQRAPRRERGDPRRVRLSKRAAFEKTCICMRLRKSAAVASSTVVHTRFRWPFRGRRGLPEVVFQLLNTRGHPPSSPPPLPPPSERRRRRLPLRIEDATAGETTIGRWEDKRSFTYMRVAPSTRIHSYYVIFRHRFFVDPTRARTKSDRHRRHNLIAFYPPRFSRAPTGT